ncbi:MAG TPA: rod shape-determining protein MreC [Firmicutes bacterium]|nr:rod shape-determining protein MreC [Bacillota bacterium]
MRSTVVGLPFGEFLILAILVGLSIGIMVFDRYDPDHSPLVFIAAPLEPLRVLARNIFSVRYLEYENSILKARLTRLSYENALLREELQRRSLDARLLEFSKQYPESLIFARVMSYLGRRDGGGMVINKGSDAHVTTNMVVITPNGLVGIVTKVGLRASQVRLIDEPGYRVSAMIRRKRATGIMRATADGRLLMEWVAPDADVALGDTVVTSGLGLVAPYGIPIGMVVDVEMDPQRFSKLVEVKPFQDPRHLEQVGVILKRPPDFTEMLRQSAE